MQPRPVLWGSMTQVQPPHAIVCSCVRGMGVVVHDWAWRERGSTRRAQGRKFAVLAEESCEQRVRVPCSSEGSSPGAQPFLPCTAARGEGCLSERGVRARLLSAMVRSV